MEKKSFDLAVIGSGPGGYVAAIRAAQRGLSTCLIEAKETGGTCLNRGCIPSKALIASSTLLRHIKKSKEHGIHLENLSFDYHEMAARKDRIVLQIRTNLESLIQRNQIVRLQGFGTLISPNQIKIQGKDAGLIEAKQIILATGSEPRALPLLPVDGQFIHDSTSFLALDKLPKRLVIVGGGIIGCEFACLHHTLGVEVTIVEMLPSILSTEGTDVAQTMTASLQKQGIRIFTDTMVKQVEHRENHLLLDLSNGESIETDMVLVSVGRKYNTDRIGLDKAGLFTKPDGSIETNSHMQTSLSHIYAIGDITGISLLAHVASHQGLVAADHAAGYPAIMHYDAIPSVIFTQPEVATVGYTLEKAQKAGYKATLGAFPFQALGKAQAVGETEGFAQVVVDQATGEILGAQVVGSNASNLIAEMTLARSAELTSETIQETIHAHPTFSEAWMEALFLADHLPLHLPPKKKG